MANESTTYQTYLMKGSGSGTITWAKLVDIKDYPDLGGDPEQVEITTLSDPMRRYLAGIQDVDSLEFTANYTATDYATLAALAHTQTDFAVWFDDGTAQTPGGALGKFSFKGELTVYATGGGVNDPREMKIVITTSTAITFAAS